MTDVVRFVILAAPRTGSNLLCTLLNSHPEILCHHEVFNPQGVFTARDYQGAELRATSLKERDDDPLSFLERVWESGTGQRCVGFKWTRGQDECVLETVCKDPGVKKIVLRRRNRIKTFVSERIAQRTNQWEVYSEQDLLLPRPRIRVDVDDLLQHIANNESFYAGMMAWMTSPPQPCLEMEYESIFDPQVQDQVFRFLGVCPPETPPVAGSVKQNPTDLRDAIANFDELCSQLTDPELVGELADLGM